MKSGNPQFPVVSDTRIEKHALDLLADYFADKGGEIAIPVPVEVIAEQYLGYQIDIVDHGLFCDPDYLGGIDFDENLIYVNAAIEDHEGRYNFTLAHEIGHHVLHRRIYLAERPGETSDILCRETRSKPLIEQQADQFAAALLMPAAEVDKALSMIEFVPASSVQGMRAVAAKIIKVGGFSNVSNTAMVNRLIGLGYSRGASYQTGTHHDFSRRSSYQRYSKYPPPVPQILRRLYRYVGQLRRRPTGSRDR